MPAMPEPWTIASLAMAWLLGVALLVWLVWRAARADATEQERAEDAETPEHPVSHHDDRAA
jgi:threonine/homoserine/homoserine lactone efflux protein